jgi:hypothetical protein
MVAKENQLMAWDTNKEPWLVWITHHDSTPGLHGWRTEAITAPTRNAAIELGIAWVERTRRRLKSFDVRRYNGGPPGQHHDSICKLSFRSKQQKHTVRAYRERIETLIEDCG